MAALRICERQLSRKMYDAVCPANKPRATKNCLEISDKLAPYLLTLISYSRVEYQKVEIYLPSYE